MAIHLWRDDLWQGCLARDRGTLWMFSWFPSTFTPNAFYSTALFITCGLELSSNSLFTAASHYTQLNTWTTLEIICFSGEHVPLFRGWIQPFMHEFLSIVLKKKVLYSHTHSHSWINIFSWQFSVSFLVFRICISSSLTRMLKMQIRKVKWCERLFLEGKNVLGAKMCVGNIKDLTLTKKPLSICCISDCFTF